MTGVNNGRGGTVTFTWDNPSNGQIDKYQYRYDATESNPVEGDWDVDWTNIPDQSAVPNGQANNQDMTGYNTNIPGSSATLFYQLRAVNNDADDSSTSGVNEGAGPTTAIPVARTNTPGESPDPPTAPADLTAAPGVQQVTLNWTASSAATQEYQVRQSSSQDEDENAVWTDWADIPKSGDGEDNRSSYTVTGLTNGTTYTFELRAKAGTAEAPIYGAAAPARPITPGAPNAPIDLIVRADADEEIFISWSERAPITGAHVPDSSTVNAKAATPTGASGKRSSAVTLLILTIP